MTAHVVSREVGGGWFADLCREHGLVPAAPVLAGQLDAGRHVLWTATGEPRRVVRTRRHKRTVGVEYADGWVDVWPLDARITLIAERA